MSNSSIPPVAVCVLQNSLRSGSNGGVIYIYEEKAGLRFHGYVYGIPEGLHGFHIHEYGDLTEGCTSLCSHFNPLQQPHGGRTGVHRHMGDLGNISVKYDPKRQTTVSRIDLKGQGLTLEGRFGILGRSLVIHEDQDDEGKTNHPLSKTTGNSGARILCGIIGRARPSPC